MIKTGNISFDLRGGAVCAAVLVAGWADAERDDTAAITLINRSEERRVGKE